MLDCFKYSPLLTLIVYVTLALGLAFISQFAFNYTKSAPSNENFQFETSFTKKKAVYSKEFEE